MDPPLNEIQKVISAVGIAGIAIGIGSVYTVLICVFEANQSWRLFVSPVGPARYRRAGNGTGVRLQSVQNRNGTGGA